MLNVKVFRDIGFLAAAAPLSSIVRFSVYQISGECF